MVVMIRIGIQICVVWAIGSILMMPAQGKNLGSFGQRRVIKPTTNKCTRRLSPVV